jgi:hypothetical protein
MTDPTEREYLERGASLLADGEETALRRVGADPLTNPRILFISDGGSRVATLGAWLSVLRNYDVEFSAAHLSEDDRAMAQAAKVGAVVAISVSTGTANIR